jgi:hypothetical protein
MVHMATTYLHWLGTMYVAVAGWVTARPGCSDGNETSWTAGAEEDRLVGSLLRYSAGEETFKTCYASFERGTTA